MMRRLTCASNGKYETGRPFDSIAELLCLLGWLSKETCTCESSGASMCLMRWIEFFVSVVGAMYLSCGVGRR